MKEHSSLIIQMVLGLVVGYMAMQLSSNNELLGNIRSDLASVTATLRADHQRLSEHIDWDQQEHGRIDRRIDRLGPVRGQ